MHKKSIYQEENFVKGYEEDRYGGKFGTFLYDLEVESFSSQFDTTDQSVLDVGAGTGKLCVPLSQLHRQVVAIDISQLMMRYAKGNAANRGAEIVTVVCDAQSLCFNDETFDCVVSSRLLLHLPDWREGIAEMCRVSKDVLIIDFPPSISFGGIDSLFKKLKKKFDSSTQTYTTFFIKKVVDELQKNHFRIVTINRQLFLPIKVHRWLDNPSLSSKIENVFRVLGLTELFGVPVKVKAERITNYL